MLSPSHVNSIKDLSGRRTRFGVSPALCSPNAVLCSVLSSACVIKVTVFAERGLAGSASHQVKDTTHRIKKEPSICHSLLRPDLVSVPVLSQIKPQAWEG